MKNCRIYRGMFVEALYGELSPADREAFSNHMKNCPHCADEFAALQNTVNELPEPVPTGMSPEYWDGFWARLEPRLPRDRKADWNRWRTMMLPDFMFIFRRALVPIAALLLVVGGIFIGRNFFSPAPLEHPDRQFVPLTAGNTAVAGRATRQPLDEYLKSMEPLLLDWVNASWENGGGAGGVMVSEEELKKLLLQN